MTHSMKMYPTCAGHLALRASAMGSRPSEKKHRKSGYVLGAVGSKKVSGSTVRRQHTENSAKSPTEKETGGDKFDSPAAKSQTDVQLKHVPKGCFYNVRRVKFAQSQARRLTKTPPSQIPQTSKFDEPICVNGQRLRHWMEHLFDRAKLFHESFRAVWTDVSSSTWSKISRLLDTA